MTGLVHGKTVSYTHLDVYKRPAVTLASYVLPKLEKGEWKRVLFVPTGALMSTVSFNEGASVPGIAHGIVLESDA